MRRIRYRVLTLTAVTCIAVVLICAFLGDKHSMVHAIMPVKEYMRHQTSIINISSNPFSDSNSNKQITNPKQNMSRITQQSISNISLKTLRTVSPSVTFSVVPNESLDSTRKESIPEPQSPTNISSNTSQKVTTTWTTEREEMVRNRYDLRKKLLTEICSKTSGNPGGEEEERQGLLAIPKLSYYVEKYRFFGCVPAKSGVTTWKLHFLRMNGYTKPIEYPHLYWVHGMLRARQNLNRQQADEVLNSPLFTRVISVRHPVSRLISAYTSKFYNGRLHIPDIETSFVKYVKEMEGTELQEGQPVAVTFRQFLKLILYQKNQGLENMNNHWRPQHSLCYACSVSYDYIVNLETFDEDLQYLIKKLQIKEVNVSLKKNVSYKPSNITYEGYFRDIPKDMLREIFLLYRPDFLLFGYEVPKFFKDLSLPKRE